MICVTVKLTREICTVPLIATCFLQIVFETPVVVITLVMFDVAALIVVLHCSVPCTRPFGASCMKPVLLSPAGMHWSSFGSSVPALPAHKCAQDDR